VPKEAPSNLITRLAQINNSFRTLPEKNLRVA